MEREQKGAPRRPPGLKLKTKLPESERFRWEGASLRPMACNALGSSSASHEGWDQVVHCGNIESEKKARKRICVFLTLTALFRRSAAKNVAALAPLFAVMLWICSHFGNLIP